LLHYTRIENAYKVCKKTFDFLSCIEASKLSFPFSLLRHYQIPECFLVKKADFELVQQFCYATDIGNAATAVSACADQP